jgi:hypothetical protein
MSPTPESVEDLDANIHKIIREIDHLYDRVSELKTKRHEPVRSLLAAAGMILAQDRKMIAEPDNDKLDPTTIQLVVIALHELGLKLKGYDL